MPPSYSTGFAHPETGSRSNARRSQSHERPRRASEPEPPPFTFPDVTTILFAPLYFLFNILCFLYNTLAGLLATIYFSALWAAHLLVFLFNVYLYYTLFHGKLPSLPPNEEHSGFDLFRIIFAIVVFGPALRFLLGVLPLGGGREGERTALWYYRLLSIMPLILVAQITLTQSMGLAFLKSRPESANPNLLFPKSNPYSSFAKEKPSILQTAMEKIWEVLQEV